MPALFTTQTHPEWLMEDPWLNCCIRTGPVMEVRGVEFPSKCSPFFPNVLIFYLGKVPKPIVCSVVQQLLPTMGWGLEGKLLRTKIPIAALLGLTP